jgi:hypothetical protein
LSNEESPRPALSQGRKSSLGKLKCNMDATFIDKKKMGMYVGICLRMVMVKPCGDIRLSFGSQ